MRVLALLPVVAAVRSTSMQSQIDSMTVTLKSIAATAEKDGGKITETTRGLVRQWLDTMNTTLVSSLISETDLNQQLIDTNHDEWEACETTRGSFASETVNKKAQARDLARNDHKKSKDCDDHCTGVVQLPGSDLLQLPADHTYWDSNNYTRDWDVRGGAGLESTKCTTAIQGELGAWTKQNQVCETLHNFVKGPANSESIVPGDFCGATENARPDSLPFADFPHNEQLRTRSYYDWEEQNTAHTDLSWFNHDGTAEDAVHAWFERMDVYSRTKVPDYKQKRAACAAARDAHKDRVLESHRLQLEFEKLFCSWAQAIDLMCSDYQTCWNSEKGEYEADEAIVQTEEAQFKQQMHSLEHIMCYGAQILEENTDLTACEKSPGVVLDCVKCNLLDITYPDPVPFVPCNEKIEDEDRPCGTRWTATEYGCFDAQTPANTCTDSCPAA